MNPGVEICAPVWVATALLCTSQPLAPRSVMSEPLGAAGALRIALAAELSTAPWLTVLATDNVGSFLAWAVAAANERVLAARAAAATTGSKDRTCRSITTNSCLTTRHCTTCC